MQRWVIGASVVDVMPEGRAARWRNEAGVLAHRAAILAKLTALVIEVADA
jgi:hypothetical protein